MLQLNSLIARYRQSTLAKNTGWMFLAQSLRLVIQAAYFIIIARSLGANQYGAFMGVAAMVGIFTPFVGLGSDKLMIKNVARNRALLDEYFGNGVMKVLVTGLVGVVIVISICKWTLPNTIATVVILMVALSDLICYRLMDMAAAAFQAVEVLKKTAQINVLISLSRFLGIAATAAVVRHPTAELWSFVYAGATAVATVISLFSVATLLQSFKLAPHLVPGELLEGFYFSTGLSAQTIYNDADKTMLVRLSTLGANGIYAAAYRLIDVSFTPVRSLLDAAYPGYFRHGQKRDIQATYGYARQLLPRPLAFSLCAFAGLVLGAPFIPKILGTEYLATVEAVRWLALLPLFKTIHYFLADALTGAGYQGLRMGIQIFVGIFNVLVNLWVIPAYSWRGAAWSSLASDGLLALLMWTAVTALRRRRPATAIDPAPTVA